MSEADFVMYCERCGKHHAPTAGCPDMINPSHYRKGNVECIDAIEAAVIGLDPMEAYYTGSAIKYLYRWKNKGGVNDLKKAKWFIDGCISYGSDETK